MFPFNHDFVHTTSPFSDFSGGGKLKVSALGIHTYITVISILIFCCIDISIYLCGISGVFYCCVFAHVCPGAFSAFCPYCFPGGHYCPLPCKHGLMSGVVGRGESALKKGT